MRAHLCTVMGNLGQSGSVKIWDGECCGTSRELLVLFCSFLWPCMHQKGAPARLRGYWFVELSVFLLIHTHSHFSVALTWTQPETHGDPPSPRHGHVVVAAGTKLFIHGGLAGDIFYNDLFCIDTSKKGHKYLRTIAVL